MPAQSARFRLARNVNLFILFRQGNRERRRYADGSHGYLRQADVIRLMELNGFELVATSEVNANPKDSANWPDGVWTLPPTYALKDKDRAKYQAIGESDRMTLLFRKRP